MAAITTMLLLCIAVAVASAFWYGVASLEKRAKVRMQKVVDAMNSVLPKPPESK